MVGTPDTSIKRIRKSKMVSLGFTTVHQRPKKVKITNTVIYMINVDDITGAKIAYGKTT